MKSDNQKNGWKGVCVNHEANGDPYFCPVRALGWRCIHILDHSSEPKTYLSAYWVGKKRADVTDQDMRDGIKQAAAEPDYPLHGILIDRVDTHSFRSGGANALHLAGYSDRQIQKMGRWRG